MFKLAKKAATTTSNATLVDRRPTHGNMKQKYLKHSQTKKTRVQAKYNSCKVTSSLFLSPRLSNKKRHHNYITKPGPKPSHHTQREQQKQRTNNRIAALEWSAATVIWCLNIIYWPIINRIFHRYQLQHSISVLRVVGWYFSLSFDLY